MYADAHLLGAYRKHALSPGCRILRQRRGDLAQPGDRKAQMAVRGLHQLSFELVDMADEIGDETGLRKTVQLDRLIDLLHFALAHHGDAMRQRQRLDLRVGDEHERDADIALQVDQVDLHLLAQLGVERTERLVEQQQARTVGQPARQRNALLLPAGQLVRIGCCLVGEVHLFENLARHPVDFGGRAARHLQRKSDVLSHRHMREQRVALEHGMHRAFFSGSVGEVFAVEQNLPGIGQIEAGDHAQYRGFAAAGRAEQREEFARLDAEADVVHGDEIAEAARDIPDFELSHIRTTRNSLHRRYFNRYCLARLRLARGKRRMC